MSSCGTCGTENTSAYNPVRSINGLRCAPYAQTIFGLYKESGGYKRGVDREAAQPPSLQPVSQNIPTRRCCFKPGQ